MKGRHSVHHISSEAIGTNLPVTTPDLAAATAVWARIGALSFGGPAAQIGLMHRIIVAEKRWLDETQFLNALSFCMLLPGPEAMQLATYVGWRLHGVVGGLIAGLLFVLPGALVILGLSLVYMLFGAVDIVGALFFGIKAAVIVIVMQALLRLAGKTLKRNAQWVMAGLGFLGIYFVNLPFPLIIALAALAGFLQPQATAAPPSSGTGLPSWRQTGKRIGLWLAVWWLPLLAIDLFVGSTIFADIGYFFSKLAIVTFGGAYAVLAYMAQDVVAHLGWLSPAEMMDGLGLAETTPGPLILVTKFVGFVTGFKAGGVWYGIAAAMVALWATFAPCFLWIFAGAPYLDWLTGQPRLRAALDHILAAVVGVIANLFLWFSLHVFFRDTLFLEAGPLRWLAPVIGSLDWRVLPIVVICGWMCFVSKASLFRILATAAGTGVVVTQLFTG